MNKEALLEIKGLKTSFFLREGVVVAVDGIDLVLNPGETLGLVGESGCGKSVTSLSIMRLILEPPGKIEEGEILFNNRDLLKFSKKEMQRIRGKELSMIFQEPMTSLNPVFTVGYQIEEVLKAHTDLSKKERESKVIDLLKKVQLPYPEKRVKSYPHELSGGMRQRVMIAMGIACEPKLLIADEPTTALDVTIQAEILKLLAELKASSRMAMLFVTHNLSIVSEIADTIAVMYTGTIVEKGAVETVYKKPLHPYTQGLLQSIPQINMDRAKKLVAIEGNVPDAKTRIPGCPFHPRCFRRGEECDQKRPQLREFDSGHYVACHYA